MQEVKTWEQKSIALDNDIQDLLDYNLDNYSKEIIKDRFLEELNKRG